MRTIISLVILVAAACLGFMMGSGMNDAMGGAAVFAVIAGFVCTIYVIDNPRDKKNREE